MKASVVGTVIGLVAWAAACTPAAEAPAAPAIASVYRRQCARCHTLPPPGQHPRPYLEEALASHHERVHLTDEEWTQLIDYLAANRS
jgi:mono/diheme cytochrome c family protein